MGVFRSGDGDREAFFYRKLQRVVKTEGKWEFCVANMCCLCLWAENSQKPMQKVIKKNKAKILHNGKDFFFLKRYQIRQGCKKNKLGQETWLQKCSRRKEGVDVTHHRETERKKDTWMETLEVEINTHLTNKCKSACSDRCSAGPVSLRRDKHNLFATVLLPKKSRVQRNTTHRSVSLTNPIFFSIYIFLQLTFNFERHEIYFIYW